MATMPSVYEFKYKTASSDAFATPLLGIGNSPYLFNGMDYDGLEITLKPGTSFSVESPILDLKGATLNLKGNVINIEGKDSADSVLKYKSSSYDTVSIICPTTTTHSVSKWYGSATLGEEVGARIIAGSCILKGETDTEPGEAVAAIGAHNFASGGSATWEDLYIQSDGTKDVYIGKGSAAWGKQDGIVKIGNNEDERGLYVNTSLDSGTPVWKEVATKEYVDQSSNMKLWFGTLNIAVDGQLYDDNLTIKNFSCISESKPTYGQAYSWIHSGTILYKDNKATYVVLYKTADLYNEYLWIGHADLVTNPSQYVVELIHGTFEGKSYKLVESTES